MFTVFGTPIGGGIVTGRACVVESRLIDVPRYRLDDDAVGGELERLKQAVAEVTPNSRRSPPTCRADAPTEAQGAARRPHHDPRTIRRSSRRRARWSPATWSTRSGRSPRRPRSSPTQFREIDDPYLKERGRDVEQVTSRLLKALAGSRLEVRRPEPGESLIFVAHDITPADMLQLKGALGFLIEQGGIELPHRDPRAQPERSRPWSAPPARAS